jgi:hypothetical protein
MEKKRIHQVVRRSYESQTRISEYKLTPFQAALMRGIAGGKLAHGDETLMALNQTTLKSVVKKEYVVFDKDHSPVLTDLGLTALNVYKDLKAPVRKDQTKEVCEYISLMLGMKTHRERRAG